MHITSTNTIVLLYSLYKVDEGERSKYNEHMLLLYILLSSALIESFIIVVVCLPFTQYEICSRRIKTVLGVSG